VDFYVPALGSRYLGLTPDDTSKGPIDEAPIILLQRRTASAKLAGTVLASMRATQTVSPSDRH
jgi:hypothetical protein